jgi:hypothetical protein
VQFCLSGFKLIAALVFRCTGCGVLPVWERSFVMGGWICLFTGSMVIADSLAGCRCLRLESLGALLHDVTWAQL